MATLLDLKARIKAVENIKKITRAMQLVAAAKFNRAQARARGSRPYTEELDLVLSALAATSDGDDQSATLEMSLLEGEAPLVVERAKLFEQNEVKRPGVVLVTSDRGLAGAFNTRLIRGALDFFKQHPDMDPQLITLGKKGNTFFKSRNIPILHHEEGIDDSLDLTEMKRITGTLMRYFIEGEVDAIYIIYAQFQSAMVSHVTVEKFLSIPAIDNEGQEDVYILEPDQDAVYETLIPLYATTKVFATLADSFAAEHGARMAAMQMATKNAEEALDDLVLLRNRLRQAIITKELSEIVSGAESAR